MDQKRTLWIVAAVGVFLLVVVGAALILNSPALQKNDSVQTYYNPADGWVNAPKAPVSNGVLPTAAGQTPVAPISQSTPEEAVAEGVTPELNGTVPVKVENVTVITDNALVYGTGTTTTIDLNQLKSNPSVPAVTPQNTLTASKMDTAKQIEEKERLYAPVKENTYTPPAPKKEAPVKATAAATPKPAAKKAAPAKKETKAAPAKPAVPDTYWIQVGAYSAKQHADDARSILESNKLPCEEFTYKDAKGKLFYRVRVGPYTTKSEAEYWQKRIASINEFSKTDSYIHKN